jgi:hypothetical protein
MTTFVWVIGSPRSGTTFLTRLIGRNTDLMFDEPETDPMYERYRVDAWEFPDCGSLVFKWCENWVVAKQILDRFPNSYFLHTIRDPSNTVYSIAFPKAGSYPARGFEEIDGESTAERVRGAIEKWQWYTEGCLDVPEVVGDRYLAVRYEGMPDSYRDIEELTGIRLENRLEFRNRNVDDRELSMLEPFWAEMPAAAELRRRVRLASAAAGPSDS